MTIPAPPLPHGPARTIVVDDGPQGIARAAEALRCGLLVAFPTETVYGLGGDATDDRAVAAIYAAKRRPRINPLIVHAADAEGAAAVAVFDGRAHRLSETLWPGPLTMVLPRRADSGLSLLSTAGLDSVAVRVPAHPVARRIIEQTDRPVVAPSANLSGQVSPTSPQHVLEGLDGRIALLVAGGRSAIGVESTVLDLTGEPPVLLRPGAVTIETLMALLGAIEVGSGDAARPVAPGALASHYAPKAQLRLDARQPEPDEAFLAFGPDLRQGSLVANLSPRGDTVEAAANLFAMLRSLDASGAARIAVAPIPETGLGAAINDRLRRAAAPRQ
jgi:L-threonylcarbamoyladenylate synthase